VVFLKKEFNLKELQDLSYDVRKVMIDMGYKCGTSAHFGGGLSMVECLATLYNNILSYDLKDTRWDERDRFILSKGHGVLGFYATLYIFGFIGKNEIDSFQQDESEFIAHPIMDMDYGIESSNGSLGHGLSLGVGVAMAAKLKQKDYKVYVMLGDGECNEGSVWEAIMCAYHHDLDNLVAIVDRNSMQNDGHSEEIMNFFDIEKAWKGFGWNVHNVDGHDHKALYESFIYNHNNKKPKVIISNTVKGKGISFMENIPAWHHGKLTEKTYQEASEELENLQNGN